jgi:hypothetical protein
MSFKSCILNLNFPNQVLQLRANFQLPQLKTFPNLELDSYVLLSSYQNLTQALLEQSFKAFVYPVEDESQMKEFLKIYEFLNSSGNIIKAGIPIGPEKYFFLIPFRNSNVLGLYEIRMRDFVPRTVEDYARCITELMKGQELVRESFKFATEEIRKIEDYKLKLEQFCGKIEDSCKETKENLEGFKKKINELNSEFKAQEENFKKFECVKCKTNVKNVLFLPCGHVCLCSKCLKDDFKIVVDFPVPSGLLRCLVCSHQVKKTIQYNM